eukprot:6177956-Pleurochrysis_carterae.AAC.8
MPKRCQDGSSSKQTKKSKKNTDENGASSTSNAPVASASAGVTACTSAPPAHHEQQFPTEESLPHLCCGVCLSFPEAEVMQCCSGHILCRPCYERVCHDEKPTCPTCRETLDPCKPIRNMLAEQVHLNLSHTVPSAWPACGSPSICERHILVATMRMGMPEDPFSKMRVFSSSLHSYKFAEY